MSLAAGAQQVVLCYCHHCLYGSAGHFPGAAGWQGCFSRLCSCHCICDLCVVSPHWNASCDYHCAGCWSSSDGQGEGYCGQVCYVLHAVLGVVQFVRCKVVCCAYGNLCTVSACCVDTVLCCVCCTVTGLWRSAPAVYVLLQFGGQIGSVDKSWQLSFPGFRLWRSCQEWRYFVQTRLIRSRSTSKLPFTRFHIDNSVSAVNCAKSGLLHRLQEVPDRASAALPEYPVAWFAGVPEGVLLAVLCSIWCQFSIVSACYLPVLH